MSHSNYNSQLVVNTSVIQKNFIEIQKNLGAGVEIIPVLKCDAYGIGAVTVAKALLAVARIKTIAVAQVQEAIALRNAGINEPGLLVLGGVPEDAVSTAIAHKISLTVYSPAIAQAINKQAALQNRNHPIQIKIETGLNRIGVKPGEELAQLIATIKTCNNVTVQGAFSHFIDGERKNSPLAQNQTKLFRQALQQLQDAELVIPMQHLCASATTEWYPDAYFNAVRIGRRLFMDSPVWDDAPAPSGFIQEACSWRSSVVSVRTISPGEKVGYGGQFTAGHQTTVAVACVGYGDGLLPALAKLHAPILINGKPARLIGTAMDQCFIDVTGLECPIGSEVTFFGYAASGEFLSSQQVAALIQDEGVFLTTFLSNRVERVYI